MENDIRLRTATTADAAQIRAIYAHYVTDTAITFEYDVPSVEEFEQRISNTLIRYPYIVATTAGGDIVGYAYAGVFKGRAAYDWSVETTVYVKQDMHKAGIGKALYAQLEQTLKERGFQNLNACITFASQEDDPYVNNNSMMFHEHLGYALVGRFHQCGYKFGRWYDMIWMEKFIGSHPDNPMRPF